MSYGELKIDTITFTSAGVDASVSVSGLVQNPTFTGNITTTGTISGDVVRGNTVSGATVTGGAGEFGTITGNTAGFTTVTGTTVTGTTANFVTLSGTTVTGNTGQFTNITGVNIVGTTEISGATVTGDVGRFTTITGGIHTLTSGVFASGTAANPSITFVDDLDTGLFTGAANTVSLTANGAAVLTVSGTNVGVGTTSPGEKLHVNGGNIKQQLASSTNGGFNVNDGTNDLVAIGTGGFAANGGSATDGGIRTTNNLVFATGASSPERVRIDSSGNVGIGTTNPGSRLTVQSPGNSSTFFNCQNSGATSLLRLFETSGGSAQFFLSDSTGTDFFTVNAATGTVGINNTNPGYVLDLASSDTTSGLGYCLRLRHNTTAGAAAIQFTDNPVSAERGWIASDSSNNMKFATASTERLRIDGSGRVGMGTTNPNTPLHVRADDGNLLKLQSTTGMGTAGENIGLTFTQSTDTEVAKIDVVTESASNIAMSFNTYSSGIGERMRINSTGQLLIGYTSSLAGGTRLEVNSNTSGVANVAIIKRNSGTADQDGQNLDFYNFGPSATARADGTSIGAIRFYASQPTSGAAQLSAGIFCSADGTQSGLFVPSRLSFFTSDSSGSSAAAERIRIEKNGDVLIGTTNGNDYATVDGRLNVVYPSTAGATTHVIKAYHTNTSYNETGGGLLFVASRRSASSAFTMAGWYTGNDTTSITSDRKFHFRGDGNGYCDGSWTGGGADYAEYFEWSDGNTSAEDRRGISVVLDNDKIREAAAGEEPIGVISGNPSVVGDADDNRWKKKYLRDDFGSYVWEDYNPIDDDGNPKQDDDGNLIVQQRQKLNPDYNPDIEYVSREDRPEWDCVGLMGKLRIRKGQVTGARWIKMRDISDNVEEWLVR